MDKLLELFGGHGLIALLGLVSGSIMTALIGRWKRYRERQQILRGDARDTVVIHQHLIDTVDQPLPDGKGTRKIPTHLRLRSLGQAELDRVVPNGHLAAELLNRAFRVTPRQPLISMEGPEGSYLLETLNNFVCDRVANAPFEHDRYVMAPCCQPAGLAEHQPITILLVPVKHIGLFEDWSVCRNIQVERGSVGARILTLMEVARRFRAEQEQIAKLRQEGKRTRYVETMYILDLAIDIRTAPSPMKNVPWGRLEDVLKQMNLE